MSIREGFAGAVGDITGKALLTHMGKYQARICGAVIAARADGREATGPRCTDVADYGRVPQVTFTDPQVASVGLSEQQARRAGVDVESVEYDMAGFAGSSLLRDGYAGRAKLVIDRSRDVLVGATFVGADVAELVHAATVAAMKDLDLKLSEDKADQVSAHLESEFADGKHVWIDLESIPENRTNLTIRVGLTGDEMRAKKIHEAIKRHLPSA